jgi:hypothetical protein
MEFMARMREVEEEAIELENRLFATYSSYSDTCGGHASLAS